MADQLKKIVVDGLLVEVTDGAEAAINKLTSLLAQSATAMTTADAAHTAAKTAWDTEKTRLETELAAAKAATPTGDALAALVTAHTKLVADAKVLAPALDVSGKSPDDVRKLAVTAKLGDAAVVGKDATWFNTVFDLLVLQGPGAQNAQTPSAADTAALAAAAAAAADPLRTALAGGGAATVGDAADTAWNASVDDMTQAWMAPDQRQQKVA